MQGYQDTCQTKNVFYMIYNVWNKGSEDVLIARQ